MIRSDPAARLPLILALLVLAGHPCAAQETNVPPPATTAPAAPLPSPKAIAIAFAAAVERGDVASAKALVTPDPGHARWAAAAVELATALKKLDAAGAARFGEGSASVSQNQLHMSDAVKGLEQAQEKVEGDDATVTPAGQARPLKLRRVEGKWLLVPPLPDGRAEPAIGLYRRLTEAANRTAGEIASGRYKAAADAGVAFAFRVTEARLDH